jgi:AraC-like DNA-binding protein
MKEIIVTLLLLASIQGFLLALVLFARKANHTANRMLAFAVLCLSLDLLTSVYYAREWYRLLPHLMGFTYPFPLLYGPSFYIYAKLVSKKETGFRKHNWIHFLPAIIVYLLCLPIFFYSGEQKIEFLHDMLRGIHSPMFSVFEVFLPFQGMAYTLFTFRIIREYDRNIKNAFSNIDLINLNWLKYITFCGLIIWSLVIVVFVLKPYTNKFDMAIQIALAVLIYILGYRALKQPEIFFTPQAEVTDASGSEKYKRSGLSNEFADEIVKKLKKFMESDKPYLDNDLTMQKLAERLNVSLHNLSEVINTRLKLSYYDFINNYRVEEFKSRIADPSNDRYNILSVAYDSGFKSKGTFNSIFKKNTGLTPSEYKLNIPKLSRPSV